MGLRKQYMEALEKLARDVTKWEPAKWQHLGLCWHQVIGEYDPWEGDAYYVLPDTPTELRMLVWSAPHGSWDRAPSEASQAYWRQALAAAQREVA